MTKAKTMATVPTGGPALDACARYMPPKVKSATSPKRSIGLSATTIRLRMPIAMPRVAPTSTPAAVTMPEPASAREAKKTR